MYHIAWYEERKSTLIVYGGLSTKDKVLQDMYALDTTSWVWRKFFSLEWPPARIHPAFISIHDRKYFLGGTSYPENLLFNDIWYSSFRHVVWRNDSLDLPGLSWVRLHLHSNSP